MKKEFYRAFEDKFRGSRAEIKQRIRIYLPFLKAIQSTYPSMQVLDIGCGRGEWLELLRDESIEAFGVDLDQGMLAACEEIGLKVKNTDGINYLKKLPNEQLEVISLFHVAEHVAFEQLQVLINEALRALKPGGLLIIETPNPENLVVGSENFYLDPSHTRPIPMQLLMFLTEFIGFKKSKILRMQENQSLLTEKSISLQSVLNGVSPDYAVVAQKDAPVEVLDKLNDLFVETYGVDLGALARRYDGRVAHLESSLEIVQFRIAQLWKLTYPFRCLVKVMRRSRVFFTGRNAVE